MLYLSCHQDLEREEVKLFRELGIDATTNGHIELDKEYLDQFDVIYSMWMPEWVASHWESIKDKTVIMRTIGQSIEKDEKTMKPLKEQGMKIVRYSPMEEKIPSYCGGDATIRFHKDENEFKDWNGEKEQIINITQSIKERAQFCGYDYLMEATEGLPRKFYGRGNSSEDPFGGELSYEELKKTYRDNRVYFYTGTFPASYTINFIEAWMTGIPIVALGEQLGSPDKMYPDHFIYEIPELITNFKDGVCADSIQALKTACSMLLSNPDYEMSINGRNKAIAIFGKERARKEWTEFFKGVGAL